MEMKKFFGLGIIAGIIGGCFTFGAIYAVTKQGISVSTNIRPVQVVDSQGAYGLQNAFVQVVKMVKP
ncbi:MAG: hypothetical protein ACPL3Q_08595, partial [Candidatus Ratteibacteria bacterium]